MSTTEVGKGIVMSKLASCLLLLLFLSFSFGVVDAEPSRTGANEKPRISAIRTVCREPRLPDLPKAGGVFDDPTFGTRIMRVTDETDGRSCNNAYSYWPSFNRDSSRFFIWCGEAPMLYRFDPDGFKILGKERLFSSKLSSGCFPRWEDAIWSGTEPDILFCHEGLNLWRYDVGRKAFTLVKDFGGELPPGHLSQMSKSLDDHMFAFSLQNPRWEVVGFIVWCQGEDRILLKRNAHDGLDEVQLDKTGRYLVVKTGKQGKGIVEVRVMDLHTRATEDLTDDGPDFAPGHSDNGRAIIIGADNWNNRITFRELSNPHQVRTVLDLGKDWSQDYHVSMLANDESWALVSLYVANTLPSSGIFRNEILLVATDGSQRVRRLAHHRTVFKEYWDSPRANISRDGRFVVFTSNWGGRSRRDVFVVMVP